jgi:hypothetical protein
MRSSVGLARRGLTLLVGRGPCCDLGPQMRNPRIANGSGKGYAGSVAPAARKAGVWTACASDATGRNTRPSDRQGDRGVAPVTTAAKEATFVAPNAPPCRRPVQYSGHEHNRITVCGFASARHRRRISSDSRRIATRHESTAPAGIYCERPVLTHVTVESGAESPSAVPRARPLPGVSWANVDQSRDDDYGCTRGADLVLPDVQHAVAGDGSGRAAGAPQRVSGAAKQSPARSAWW